MPALGKTKGLAYVILFAGLIISPRGGLAQPVLQIYTDHLVNGFQDWSWPQGGDNVTNTTPVHSGSNSFEHKGGAWNAITLQHPDFDTTLYTNFSFWANGGASAGQIISVFAQIGTNETAAA